MVQWIFRKGHFIVPLFVLLVLLPSKSSAKECDCFFYLGLGFIQTYTYDVNFSHYAETKLKGVSGFSALGRSDYASAFLLLHGIYSLFRKRDVSFEKRAIASIAASGLLVTLLKYTFHRTRPNSGKNNWQGPGLYPGNVSFPSGHTQVAFSLASSLSEKYGYPYVFYTLAGLVGLARIVKNMHYLSDVVVGAYSGYCVDKIIEGEKRHFKLFITRNTPYEVRLFYSLK